MMKTKKNALMIQTTPKRKKKIKFGINKNVFGIKRT